MRRRRIRTREELKKFVQDRIKEGDLWWDHQVPGLAVIKWERAGRTYKKLLAFPPTETK